MQQKKIVGDYGWRNVYLLLVAARILLLLLRIGTFESGMFKTTAKTEASKRKYIDVT